MAAMTKKIVPIQPPLAICPELPAFDPEDLANVRLAFDPATPVSSQQGWLAKHEKDFAPMIVRVGWQRNGLFVFAELTDVDVFTRATAHNQRFWELGDVFEIFLRPMNQASYVEFQVTPNNRRLQLRYPNAKAVAMARKAGSAADFVIRKKAFYSQIWLCPKEKKWFVLARIPFRSVSENGQSQAGSAWKFSFSRYDYTRGRAEPVISSTSPHAKADFHRQEEWGTLRFDFAANEAQGRD
jgi:hypothetical protein